MNMYDIKNFLAKMTYRFAPTSSDIADALSKIEAKIELAINKGEYEIDATYEAIGVLEGRMVTLNRELDTNYKLLNKVNVMTK